LALIQATRVVPPWVKALSGDRQGGMCLSYPRRPLLCRDTGGERHTCVSMTTWPIFQVLALVLFLVLSIFITLHSITIQLPSSV
jgi:hypothetical protein